MSRFILESAPVRIRRTACAAVPRILFGPLGPRP